MLYVNLRWATASSSRRQIKAIVLPFSDVSRCTGKFAASRWCRNPVTYRYVANGFGGPMNVVFDRRFLGSSSLSPARPDTTSPCCRPVATRNYGVSVSVGADNSSQPNRSLSTSTLDVIPSETNCSKTYRTRNVMNEAVLVEELDSSQQNRLSEARDAYSNAVFQYGEIHSTSIELLVSVGDLYWDFGQLDSAQETHELALQQFWELHGGGTSFDHPIIASILHKLGSIHARRAGDGSEEEATRWYGRALEMKQRLVKSPDFSRSAKDAANAQVELATTLNGIAMIKAEQGEASEALKVFQEAERLTRLASGESEDNCWDEDLDLHPYVADICENIGALHIRNGPDYQAALTQFEEALRIVLLNSGKQCSDTKKNRDEECEHVSTLHMSVGDCHYGLKEYKEARDAFEKGLRALSMAENAVEGEENTTSARKNTASPLAAILHHNLGLTQAELGNFDEAIGHYRECLDIKKTLVGDEHPECAATMNCMGATYGTKGEKDIALTFFREALRIYRLSSDNDETHPSVVNTKRNIALIEGALLK